MRTIPNFSVLILSWVVAGLALSASAFELDFHSKVVAIYSFEPHKLTEAETKAKSDELDQFWSSVKGDRQKYLPLLRRELSDPSNSAFFFYDGSKLLLSLSKDRNDQALALRSMPKADLHGVQHTDYLQTIHWLARNGFNTREAAFRILAFPDFKAFIPQHALTLGQNFSLIYMLFPMDESIFVADLASRLSSQNNDESLKTIVLALWYTVTPLGHAAIKNFIEDPKSPEKPKAYATELLARKVPSVGGMSAASSKSLREQRRKLMRRPISDEALIEFDMLTVKLLAKQ